MRLTLLVLVACASTQAARPGPVSPELATLKGKVMAADYRGDLGELAKLRDELAPFKRQAGVDYLGYYWAGFASWRLAMNGTNQGMKEDEVRQHLLGALADMYLAIKLRDDFADGYAAAAGINGWVIGSMMRTHDDPQGIVEHAALAAMLLARAKALAPDNPRVLWIEGGFQLVQPPERGGGQAIALATLTKMVAITEHAPLDPRSPLPDWGRPEALMMVANADLAATPPDVAGARTAAKAALALEPDWMYVRDILLPKIDATNPTSPAGSR